MSTLPCADIAAHLADKGYGTVGSTIFIGYLPTTPDNCISVFEYAGSAPDRTHDGSGNERPSIQIRVRNTSNLTALTKVRQVYNTLDGSGNFSQSGTYYVRIDAINSGAIPMGQDGNERFEYTWNFAILRRR